MTVLHIVTGGPEGEVRYRSVLDGGHLSVAPADADAAAGDDPEVTLTTPHTDALAIARGELDANVAFMRGRSKTTGPTGPLLAVLAAPPDDAYRAAVLELLAP